MSDLLEIRTLGGLAIRYQGAPLTGFGQRKEEALLVYLACTGRAHPRETLAELFWEERSQAHSLANLRVVLNGLRQRLPDHLMITRQSVALDPSAALWLDSLELDENLAGAQHSWMQTGTLSASMAAPLERGLALYQGDFLAGFSIRDCPAFEEWARSERERLRRDVMDAYHHLVDHYLESGDCAAGIRHATHLLQLDPLHEAAHRQLMHLLARSGNRAAALNQYENCRRLLEDELGVAPSGETVALYESIQGSAPAITTMSAKPFATEASPASLPPQPTPFIGRSEELAQIGERLADPDCRLLTLIGGGGIGKTRLALQAAAQVNTFSHGVHFIGLASVNSADLIALTIGSALKFSFYGQEDRKEQLFSYLREKEMLLILDNLEHVLEGVGLLSELLTNAPRIKILATSRERLNLQEEWALLIEGLPFPDEDATDRLESYAAIQLFVQRAKQIQPRFSLAAHRSAVVAVCRRVEGMPLAIELAVTWLRAVPCEQIAEQIARGADFLATPLRNVPERQRSLRAVFDYSWKLLSDAERAVLPKLSVFRGGFDLEAAEPVAGASLSTVAGLVDKSFARINPSGRYDLHELVRQYTSDRLNEGGEAAAAASAHLQFFLALAEGAEKNLYSPQQAACFERLDAEYDNLRAALEGSLERDQLESGLRLAGALGWYWHLHGDLTEGRAWLGRLLSRSDKGISPLIRAKAMNHAGDLACLHGDFQDAKALCESGFALAQEAQDDWSIAWSLSNLGFALGFQNQPGSESSLVLLEKALRLFKVMEDKWGLHHALNRMATLAASQGDFEKAIRLAEDDVALCREAGDKDAIAWSLMLLGDAASFQTSDLPKRADLYKQALALFEDVHDTYGATWMLLRLGSIARFEAKYEQSRRFYGEGLALGQQMGNPKPLLFYFLNSLASLFVDCHLPQQAARLLSAIIVNYEIINARMFSSVQARLEKTADIARSQLGGEAFAAAWAEGRAMSLEQAITYALEAIGRAEYA